MSEDPNINYGITFVACFDEESNQKIRDTMKLISQYRICKIPRKNGNREDLDTLPYHSTISSWKIRKEPEIVEQIRKFFYFKSFSSDFRVNASSNVLCLEPIQEEHLRRLETQAYNLKPKESYDPDSYHLHVTLNINPDKSQIKEQYKILKDVVLNLKITEARLYEIYPATLVCSVNEDGFHLHKEVKIKIPKCLSLTKIDVLKKNEKNFDGIIRLLNDSVKVSSSSVCHDDLVEYGPLNVINRESAYPFSSKDEENSWIMFNFEDRRIKPTSYEIMSSDAKKNYSHMKTWVLEGSNDNNQWNVIDENKDCEFLNKPNAIHTFNINKDDDNFYQFLRIRQTGLNCKGKNFMKFKQIEFYGMIDNEIKKNVPKDNEKSFDGIINHLKDSIKVTASSVCHDDLVEYGPLNVINRESAYPFSSKDEENSWIMFNFEDRRIKPTSYEIMSSDAAKDFSHMKTWVVEGSNDSNQWNVIDENKDCEFLNGPNATYSIKKLHDSGIPYQFLRIRQTGLNCKGKNFMKFKQIEFYGTVIENS